MVSNYQHHLYPRQSEYVKYRGKTGRIDVKDSIIAVLAKKPGLNQEDIGTHIYHHTLRKSCAINIPRALEKLMEEGIVVREEGSTQFYLQNDALTHDIGKVKSIMDQLMAKGLTPENIVFLSSAMIMNAESKYAQANGSNYHSNDSVASAPVVKPENPEGWQPSPYNPDSEVNTKELNEINAEQLDNAIKNAYTENGTIKDPFENMPEIEMSKWKQEIIRQLHEEAMAKEEARLKAEMELEAEIARQQIEKRKKEEEAAAEAEETERRRLLDLEIEQKENKQQEYKNKITGIKSAADLLGLDVEIKIPESTGMIIGTILEVKSDGILFMIVFSQDEKYPEGSIQNLFYADKLSYKVRL